MYGRTGERRACAFFAEINGLYRECNPYHSKLHAADVCQTMHHFLTRGRLLAGGGGGDPPRGGGGWGGRGDGDATSGGGGGGGGGGK